jgi:cytochrome bd-type quinol oxidase subunit 2
LILGRRRGAKTRGSKRLSAWALLLLGVALAGVIAFLTWPPRAAISCEQLPELTALAVCAETLFVFSIRTLALENTRDRRLISAGASILAALAFFLAIHYVALYRAPCIAVQHRMHGR